jgi:hypothetical protein
MRCGRCGISPQNGVGVGKVSNISWLVLYAGQNETEARSDG